MLSSLAAAVLVAQLSSAGGPVPPAGEPAPDAWYGTPALVTDGVALPLAAGGLAAKNVGLFALGGAGYLVGAPINHLANGRPGAAVGSFFLRQGAVVVAGFIFFANYIGVGCDGDGSVDGRCEVWPGLLAGGIVLAGATLLDDLLIARTRRRAAPARRVSLAPGVVITPNVGLLSLGGRF